MKKEKMILKRMAAYQFAEAFNKDYNIVVDGKSVVVNVLDCRGVEFSLAVNKTKNRLQSIIREAESKRGIANPQIRNAFEAERIKAVTEHSNKDEKGVAIMKMDNGRRVFDVPEEKMEELNKAIEAISQSEKYKEHFDNAQEAFRAFTEAEIDFCEVFHCVKEEDLSNDITSNMIDDINFMIIFDK